MKLPKWLTSHKELDSVEFDRIVKETIPPLSDYEECMKTKRFKHRRGQVRNWSL